MHNNRTPALEGEGWMARGLNTEAVFDTEFVGHLPSLDEGGVHMDDFLLSVLSAYVAGVLVAVTVKWLKLSR